MINSGTFVKVRLIFKRWIISEDWNKNKEIDLSMGSFHAGTTFNADLYLRRDEINDLKEALKEKNVPIFELELEEK